MSSNCIKVCESLPIGQPPLLLGYTWQEDGLFNDQAVQTEESFIRSLHQSGSPCLHSY